MMCDYAAGRLLLATHRKDKFAEIIVSQIRRGDFEHIEIVDDIDRRLERYGSQVPEGFSWNLFLLNVPEGEELWKINQMYQWAAKFIAHMSLKRGSSTKLKALLESARPISISLDHHLAFCSSIKLDADHQTYKKLLKPPAGHRGVGQTLAILDSGIDASLGIKPSKRSRNFNDDANPNDVTDKIGHGSIIANIIKDIAPDCELIVHKVGDKNPVSEWDVLHALTDCADADIVNLSLAFSMSSESCRKCGRSENHSSRSIIFQLFLEDLAKNQSDTVFVAAAGNRGVDKLDFPARYSNVLAVGGLDSSGSRPAYSNFGNSGHGSTTHRNLFFAPGGGNGESVASIIPKIQSGVVLPPLIPNEGTSFSAAYVSGMLALHRSIPGTNKDRQSILRQLRSKAVKKDFIGNYVESEFGNGLIRI